MEGWKLVRGPQRCCRRHSRSVTIHYVRRCLIVGTGRAEKDVGGDVHVGRWLPPVGCVLADDGGGSMWL